MRLILIPLLISQLIIPAGCKSRQPNATQDSAALGVEDFPAFNGLSEEDKIRAQASQNDLNQFFATAGWQVVREDGSPVSLLDIVALPDEAAFFFLPPGSATGPNGEPLPTNDLREAHKTLHPVGVKTTMSSDKLISINLTIYEDQTREEARGRTRIDLDFTRQPADLILDFKLKLKALEKELAAATPQLDHDGLPLNMKEGQRYAAKMSALELAMVVLGGIVASVILFRVLPKMVPGKYSKIATYGAFVPLALAVVFVGAKSIASGIARTFAATGTLTMTGPTQLKGARGPFELVNGRYSVVMNERRQQFAFGPEGSPEDLALGRFDLENTASVLDATRRLILPTALTGQPVDLNFEHQKDLKRRYETDGSVSCTYAGYCGHWATVTDTKGHTSSQYIYGYTSGCSGSQRAVFTHFDYDAYVTLKLGDSATQSQIGTWISDKEVVTEKTLSRITGTCG